MTVILIVGIVAFVAFTVWLMHDEHFADPTPPSRLRRRQLDDIVERDEVLP